MQDYWEFNELKNKVNNEIQNRLTETEAIEKLLTSKKLNKQEIEILKARKSVILSKTKSQNDSGNEELER